MKRIGPQYASLTVPGKAIVRDLNYLIELKAVKFERREGTVRFFIRLEWPTEITESEFFAYCEFFAYWKKLPRAKTYSFLS